MKQSTKPQEFEKQADIRAIEHMLTFFPSSYVAELRGAIERRLQIHPEFRLRLVAGEQPQPRNQGPELPANAPIPDLK